MSGAADRRLSPWVDAIKAFAAQLIVLHHLAWFGPMSNIAAHLSPLAAVGQDWLVEYGRYAVAAFLVMGGYLSAHTLSFRGRGPGCLPLHLIGRRYLRLVLPFAVALLLAMVCAFLARQWMEHDSIGAPPTLWQFVAHLLLLHGLLGVESLSAGVWYVAIDFQLYASLVGLIWLAGLISRRPASADFFRWCLVGTATLASLFFFNRDPGWDSTALYFFGAYGLGVLSRWAMETMHPIRLLALIGLVGAAALIVDFRARLAIALGIALLLALVRPAGASPAWVTKLGQSSYALFLVHFPVCLLVNALFYRLFPQDPLLNLLGLIIAWLASNIAALFFFRQVERRLIVWSGISSAPAGNPPGRAGFPRFRR